MQAVAGSKRCACGKTISANALFCRTCASAAPARQCGGVLEILNVQGGDVKITFDSGDIADTIRAKRIVTDMLRRGYALVVEVEREGVKAYERVQAFDEARGEYIIADFDPSLAREVDMQDEAADLRKKHDMDAAGEEIGAPPVTAQADDAEPRRGRPTSRTRMPMESTRATAVGRSAGG
jgi:hypothetical protein